MMVFRRSQYHQLKIIPCYLCQHRMVEIVIRTSMEILGAFPQTNADNYLHGASMYHILQVYYKLFVCAPCLTVKIKRSAIKNVDKIRSKTYEEVLYDISGKFSKSLIGNIHASHFIYPNTSKLEVLLLTAN